MVEPQSPPDTQTTGEAEKQYGAYYYGHDCGTPYERNEHWMKFFGDIADNLIRDLHPTSVLDAGCAMGFLVEAMRRRDVEAWGVDVSEYAISQVHESVSEYCRAASLTEPLAQRYDLITCIEVVEHIPATDAAQVISNLCQATNRLLLSSSPFDYSEATHVNVKPPEEWSAMLAREGFFRDLDRDFSYVTPWAALYTRFEEPLADTVRRYDRSWWQLRWEVTEMRNSMIKLHERLEDLHVGNSEGPGELERRQEEILRLRDLLIGKDAELGTIQGRVAELEEAVSARFVDRLRARLLARLRHRIQRLRNVR